MVWLAAAVVVLGVVSFFAAGDRDRTRRLYDEKVGLDLAGLVALLPHELRQRTFTRFMLAPWNGQRLCVGLVFQEDAKRGVPPRVGNPANVGLEFDLETGKLVQIHPQGLGLGLK